jgi:hypothetical protein
LDTYIEKSGIIDKCYFKMKRNQIQEDGAWSFCGIIKCSWDAIIGLWEELLVMPITTNC